MNTLPLFTGNIGKQQHTQTCNGKQGQERHNQQTGIKMPPPNAQIMPVILLTDFSFDLCIH